MKKVRLARCSVCREWGAKKNLVKHMKEKHGRKRGD